MQTVRRLECFCSPEWASSVIVHNLNGSEAGNLYVCKASDHSVFNPHVDERKLTEIPSMDVVTLPLFSAFYGNGYLQHAESDYFGYENQRYHVYLFFLIDNYTTQSYMYSWSLGIPDAHIFVEGTNGMAVNVAIVKTS